MNYWTKQTTGTLLFPELEWSKPENRVHAGKLLIAGGSLHGFAAPASAYNEAERAGIGISRVLLPGAIQKTVGSFMPEAEFGPSTPSGSFATKSLDVFLENAAWSDCVLLSGDFGRNSETAILLEKFVTKYHDKLVITKDSLDYFNDNSQILLERPNTLLVTSFTQLQKLAAAAKFPTAFTHSMDLVRLVTGLHELTITYPASIIVKHHDVLLVAKNGQVSSTKLSKDLEVWRVSAAARAAVWWLQHSSKPFEAMTTAVAKLDLSA